MKINNSFSLGRIKKALGARTLLIAIISVAIASVFFYVTIENRESREVTVWLVTTDAEAGLSESTVESINNYVSNKGFDRVLVVKRHPEDHYFDVVMSTGAFYTCDVFIMQEDVALKYAEMDMFMPLSAYGIEGEMLNSSSGDAIGIKLDDNYYFLINSKADIEREIIYDIYKMLVNDNIAG